MASDIKNAHPDYYSPPKEDGEALNLTKDWAVEEEARAKRKPDFIIMPLLTLGFFCLQLDRGSIANAITDRFMEEVGITQNQFNVGQQMLPLGIVLAEIPSNMIFTFQAFQANYASFIVTRFLFGITESGFIPGGIWTLSTWYTRSETAKRVMIFYFGNQFGQASAKLLAFGILHMRGVSGKSSWFWLFVLMGTFTIGSGFVLGFFLPDSFKNPHSTFLLRWQVYTEREIHILRNRVQLDDPAKGKKKRKIGLDAFKKAFGNRRLWVHFFITLSNNGPQRAFDTYAPSIVTSFGFGALRSNAMAAAGLFLQIPVSFSFSWVSDHFNRRGETVMVGFSCHLLGYVFNRIFTEIYKRGVRYFGVVWTRTFGTFSHSLNITWMSLTCTDSEERALAMAMVIMGANIAGIYGAQIFRQDDKPRYRRGFGVNIAVLTVGLTLAVARYLDDRRRRIRQAAELQSVSASGGSNEGMTVHEKIAVRPSEDQPAPIVLETGRGISVR